MSGQDRAREALARQPCPVHKPMPCPTGCPNSPETLARRLSGERRQVARLMARLSSVKADRDAARAALARVEALHVPWYEIDGVRHDHCVIVSNDDVPEGHICRVGEDSCMPEYEEHYVLACIECRQTTQDAELGYPLWPCATTRALAGDTP